MTQKTTEQILAEYSDAYYTSKLNSQEECTLKLEGCENANDFHYQKEIRIQKHEYLAEDMVQTADNIIFCCQNCIAWIMSNLEEATALGYIIR
jgi:hypothetical protein